MASPVGFIYTDASKYNFGEGHPLTPLRIELTYSLMKQYGLLDAPNISLLNPRKASDEEVLRIHDVNYLNKLKELNDITSPSYLAFPKFGLGPGDNPVFPGMYDAAMSVCGASITAADYILKEENNRAHNIVGGLHHAMSDMASGFCLLNDVAVAIQYILDKKPGSKVMYLDIDCHHGDGVQWIFYDRSDVLTLSLHQSGSTLFPGSGFTKETGKKDGLGYSLNVPFLPGTTDNVYLNTLNSIVPAVMEAYRPDYLVCQTGVDTHWADPLTNMGLSTEGHEKIFRKINGWASQHSNDKLLVLGGGGYNLGVVGRSWSMFLAELLGISIGEPLPDAWIKELEAKWDEEPAPSHLRDRNLYLEEKIMRDPFYLDELEFHADDIIKKFVEELIPAIK